MTAAERAPTADMALDMPAGMVLMFTHACPEGRTRMAEMDGRHPRGGTNPDSAAPIGDYDFTAE